MPSQVHSLFLYCSFPLLTKKGGRVHVRAGWTYTFAMIVVAGTSLIITPWRVLFDPERTPSTQNFAIFLFYISIFTLACLSHGLIALKAKQRKVASRSLIHIGPPLATILLGLLTQFIGMESKDYLLIAFPFLGHITAVPHLYYWLTKPTQKMHWWYAHMNGMFTACIATITAFLVTAVPRIWPIPIAESPIFWIAPGLILGTILNRWTAYYQHKYEK